MGNCQQNQTFPKLDVGIANTDFIKMGMFNIFKWLRGDMKYLNKVVAVSKTSLKKILEL